MKRIVKEAYYSGMGDGLDYVEKMMLSCPLGSVGECLRHLLNTIDKMRRDIAKEKTNENAQLKLPVVSG